MVSAPTTNARNARRDTSCIMANAMAIVLSSTTKPMFILTPPPQIPAPNAHYSVKVVRVESALSALKLMYFTTNNVYLFVWLKPMNQMANVWLVLLHVWNALQHPTAHLALTAPSTCTTTNV